MSFYSFADLLFKIKISDNLKDIPFDLILGSTRLIRLEVLDDFQGNLS